MLSATLSRDPIDSLWELKEVFLFVAPLVTYVAFRHPRMRKLGVLAFSAGVLVAVVWGFVQTAIAAEAGTFPGTYRPAGTFSHYMTFAGLLMVAVPVLLSVRYDLALNLVLRVLAVSAMVVIGLTMTRSAWIGSAAAIIVWLASRFVPGNGPAATRDRRSWAVLGIIVVVALAVGALVLASLAGTDVLYARGASIFSLENPANLDRLAMAATGLRIIRAYPMLGIGPGLMADVYPAWRVDWAVKEYNSHLHNNVLQIAAERGLLGLIPWLWLMVAFVVGAWRVLRHSGPHGEGGPEARAALASLTAFLVMGLFEYNYSDSEVLMALLFIVALPFAASSGLAFRGLTSGAQPNDSP